MKLRSRSLALLGVGLLAAATVLGAILVHDGESRATPLADVAPGDAVQIKGVLTPFYPSRSLAAWDPVLPILAAHNHTSLWEEPGGAVALLTSATPAPDDVVLTQGTALLVLPHPDGSGRLLVVVHVESWRQPLLFR